MTVDRALRTIDLAQAVQISVQLVREYEASGVIPLAERSPTGYRRYTQQHLAAIKTARLVIAGYGLRRAQHMMQAAHQARLPDALALMDERHAELDRTRTQLEQTLAALRVLASQLPSDAPSRHAQRLRVGEAARLVGVRISALRFWEQQGLLHPTREKESNYRLYDERQLRRLRIVALLRQANYDFPAIHTTLNELEAGQPQRAVAAVERRRTELAAMSWRALEAMAAFHAYVSDYLSIQDALKSKEESK